VNDRQLAAIPEGLQRLELGMQPEAAIEVDDAILLSRRRDRDAWPDVVITLLEKRNDNVQPVGSASLEDGNQDLLPALRSSGARKPGWRQSEAGHDDGR
jgi:hypothetical protein